jgi:hypothetical protein
MRKKSDLPTKECAVCGRPFAWRKKWARSWEQVRYCSAACIRNKAAKADAPAGVNRTARVP